jgi:hypothetical protein
MNVSMMTPEMKAMAFDRMMAMGAVPENFLLEDLTSNFIHHIKAKLGKTIWKRKGREYASLSSLLSACDWSASKDKFSEMRRACEM